MGAHLEPIGEKDINLVSKRYRSRCSTYLKCDVLLRSLNIYNIDRVRDTQYIFRGTCTTRVQTVAFSLDQRPGERWART